MKFMILLQGTQSDYDAMDGGTSGDAPVWTGDDLKAMFGFMEKLNGELAASGEMLDAQGLTAPDQGGAVTAGADGRPVVSRAVQGAEEQALVGYWLLECESFDRAAEIAARIHTCPVPEGVVSPPVIVRPVGEEPEPGQ